MNIKETDLFRPVKEYLEDQGYSVNAEVADCDITATKNNELVVIELKKQFNLKLVYQAIQRQDLCDSVYVAIPVSQDAYYPSNYKLVCKLLKRLEIGLIFVRVLKTKMKVEIQFHPGQTEQRKNRKKRNAIIREVDGRYSEYNIGGSASNTTKMTAYRQNAVQIAVFILKMGSASPAQLRTLGTGNKTQSILTNNFFGWFEKIERGIYTLHAHGKDSLKKYPELYDYFSAMYDELITTNNQ